MEKKTTKTNSLIKDLETSNADIERQLNKIIKPSLMNFTPPEKITLDEWADKYRWLSPESSAEPGPWRTDRTPYLREPMRAFTDPKVRNIVMVASSQVGKTEFELNAIGYIISHAPGSIMYVQPDLGAAREFSTTRIMPMIRDSKILKGKFKATRGRSSNNSILSKMFPGGRLKIVGTENPQSLAGTPARYIIGDERDRWAKSAGREGDPWELLKARQITYYNAKSIEVSTPTIKGASPIESSFYTGTQERWCHRCPECGEYTNIVFDTLRFQPHVEIINHKKTYSVTNVGFCCPHCGCIISEQQIKNSRQNG